MSGTPSVDLRARPLAKAKMSLPSVQKARGASPRNSGFPSGTCRRPVEAVGCCDVENARRPRGASRGGQPSCRGPQGYRQHKPKRCNRTADRPLIAAVAEQIHSALARSPDGLTRTQLRDLLHRNLPAERVEQALHTLNSTGRATRRQTPTAGRPAEIWTATPPDRLTAVGAPPASAGRPSAHPPLQRDGACLREGVARRHGCRRNWARTKTARARHTDLRSLCRSVVTATSSPSTMTPPSPSSMPSTGRRPRGWCTQRPRAEGRDGSLPCAITGRS